MTEPLQPTPSPLNAAQIDALLRLATAPPDDVLLGRFFEACTQNDLQVPITPAERRWLLTNLEANPSWQAYWKELESAYGRPVPWPQPDLPLNGLSPAPAVGAIRPMARIIPLHTRMARWAMVASFLLLAVYGGLWGLGQSMIPDTYPLASLEGFEHTLSQTRGNEAEAPPFDLGLEALNTAHQNTLGLFPHYDAEHVAQGLTHLQEAYSAATDGFQRAETAFFLAKGHLMKDDAVGAHRWLTLCLDQNVADYRDEATALLEHINKTME